VWTIISCCGDALAMFMNGSEVIGFQVVVASIFGLGCLLMKVMLVHRFGIAAVPWATISAYLLLSALPSAFFIPSLLNRLSAGSLAPEDVGEYNG